MNGQCHCRQVRKLESSDKRNYNDRLNLPIIVGFTDRQCDKCDVEIAAGDEKFWTKSENGCSFKICDAISLPCENQGICEEYDESVREITKTNRDSLSRKGRNYKVSETLPQTRCVCPEGFLGTRCEIVDESFDSSALSIKLQFLFILVLTLLIH